MGDVPALLLRICHSRYKVMFRMIFYIESKLHTTSFYSKDFCICPNIFNAFLSLAFFSVPLNICWFNFRENFTHLYLWSYSRSFYYLEPLYLQKNAMYLSRPSSAALNQLHLMQIIFDLMKTLHLDCRVLSHVSALGEIHAFSLYSLDAMISHFKHDYATENTGDQEGKLPCP